MSTRSPRPIEIVGGGLAGLSLGLALQRQGVPVLLHEAARYPRPKVCGEFIAGLDAATIARLDLTPWIQACPRHRQTTWFVESRETARTTLPAPAIGVSRQFLDTQLATALRAAGGEVRENSRVTDRGPRAGRVVTSGRRVQPGGWVGLKLHARRLSLEGDLEMHLGRGAYVGLAGVQDGRVNVCGLFAPRGVPSGAPTTALQRHLRAAGLEALARRLDDAEICPDAFAAVAGVHFQATPPRESAALALGDAYAAIPPFTGHGMAMALQSAAAAVEPLRRWSQQGADWSETVTLIQRQLRRLFRRRLLAARLLHPWLLQPRGQRLLVTLLQRRLLPFRLLYHLSH